MMHTINEVGRERIPRKTILVTEDVYAELMRVKDAYPVRLSFTQLFRVALPRCPSCNSLLVQLPGRAELQCVNCGRRYKLETL